MKKKHTFRQREMAQHTPTTAKRAQVSKEVPRMVRRRRRELLA